MTVILNIQLIRATKVTLMNIPNDRHSGTVICVPGGQQSSGKQPAGIGKDQERYV